MARCNWLKCECIMETAGGAHCCDRDAKMTQGAVETYCHVLYFSAKNIGWIAGWLHAKRFGVGGEINR
jgi:hypothetical protein